MKADRGQRSRTSGERDASQPQVRDQTEPFFANATNTFNSGEAEQSHAALAPKVRPVEGIRQSASLSWRTLVQIKHNPTELVDFSIQPIMFLLLFTYVFGGAIAGSTGDYLTFALPGLIVQNALFGTLNTGLGLNTDLTKGVFDRLRALPIARWAPLAGRIGADMVKQAWAMALLLGLGSIMGFRVGTGVAGVLGAFGLLLVVAFAFAWISVLVGVLVSEPDKVMMFGFAVMFPLTFVSNVFVPTDTMPGWLQALGGREPGDDRGRRDPWPAGQRPGRGPGDGRAAVGGRDHGRVRARWRSAPSASAHDGWRWWPARRRPPPLRRECLVGEGAEGVGGGREAFRVRLGERLLAQCGRSSDSTRP